MRFETVVDKLFGQALAQLDARNARNMVSAVRACLQGRRLVMMELARHWPGAIKIAAPLKRLDRLLGNRRVYAVRSGVYRQAMALLIRTPNPLIAVDWPAAPAEQCGRTQALSHAIEGVCARRCLPCPDHRRGFQGAMVSSGRET